MFLLPINFYIYAALIALAGVGFVYGKHEHNLYNDYKNQVVTEAKAKEIENKQREKQNEIINQGVVREHQANVSAIRNYYNGLLNTSSSSMPTIGASPKGVNGYASYNQLAEQCAETTNQLVELQNWINTQIGLK